MGVLLILCFFKVGVLLITNYLGDTEREKVKLKVASGLTNCGLPPCSLKNVGEYLFPASGFKENSHAQLAVQNPDYTVEYCRADAG